MPWGRCTQKPAWNSTRLYLHVFDWPKDGQLLVPDLLNSRARARVLATGQALTIGYSPEGMTITVPDEAPDVISSTIVVDLDDKPIIKAPETAGPKADGSIGLSADLVPR
jgi:alpha-L-fucosidase